MLTAENLDTKIKKFWPKNGPSTQEVEKYVKKYSKEKIVIKCGGRVLLDPILFDYIEHKKSKLEIIKKYKDEVMVSRIIGLVNRAEYKRFQAAPVLRVSTKAFGMGRQVPIVAKFNF